MIKFWAPSTQLEMGFHKGGNIIQFDNLDFLKGQSTQKIHTCDFYAPAIVARAAKFDRMTNHDN